MYLYHLRDQHLASGKTVYDDGCLLTFMLLIVGLIDINRTSPFSFLLSWNPFFPLFCKDSHSLLVLQGINTETTLIVPFIHHLTKF